MSEELEKGRRLSRRRMGRISFLFLLVASSLIIYAVTLAPNSKEHAEALATASSVVIWVLGFFATLVCAYLGVSLSERLFKKEQE